MDKIFLRRSQSKDFRIPYSIESDDPEINKRFDFGEVSILLPFNECPYIFGLSKKRNYGIHMPIGMATVESELTEKVYTDCIKYGKKLANSLPERPKFVDETGGPVKIELGELG